MMPDLDVEFGRHVFLNLVFTANLRPMPACGETTLGMIRRRRHDFTPAWLSKRSLRLLDGWSRSRVRPLQHRAWHHIYHTPTNTARQQHLTKQNTGHHHHYHHHSTAPPHCFSALKLKNFTPGNFTTTLNGVAQAQPHNAHSIMRRTDADHSGGPPQAPRPRK